MEGLQLASNKGIQEAKRILYEGDDKTKRTNITLLITFVKYVELKSIYKFTDGNLRVNFAESFWDK